METFTRLLIATLTCIIAKTQAEPPKSIPKRADISVSGVFLEDAASTEKVPGKEIPHEEQLAYWIKHRTQLLKLLFHGGDTVHDLAELKITQPDHNASTLKAPA